MLAIMHDALPLGKCLLHERVHYRGAVMPTASARLRRAREKSGFTSAKAAAEAMGVPVATYIQHESGIRGFPSSKAERYARFFRVKPEWLLYGSGTGDKIQSLGPQLFVVGEVAAGIFKAAWEKDREEWTAFTGRHDLLVPISERFGLTVSGDSMDMLYPPGTVLECVRHHGMSAELPSGKRVIVERTRQDGQVEATVKELYRDADGVEWLVPRSHNPAHRAFRADQPDSADIAEVRVIAVVVASIRPE